MDKIVLEKLIDQKIEKALAKKDFSHKVHELSSTHRPIPAHPEPKAGKTKDH